MITGETAPPLLSREVLRRYQLEKVRELIDYVREHSPFYRRRLDGWSGRGLTCLGDLAELPWTSVRDLRTDPLQFLCISRGKIERVVSLPPVSFGEAPKRLHFTREELERTVDFFHRGMSTLAGPGDRVGILLPGDRPDSVGDLLRRGLRRLGAEPQVLGLVQDPLATAAAVQGHRLNCLVGLPLQVLALARLPNKDGFRETISGVLLCSDYIPSGLVQELERTWNCMVLSHYGLTETAYLGGVECLARRGYHLCEADLLVEIVDPETGQVQPQGEAGEIVVTTLTRRAMPLIRYRTGDLSQLITGNCSCGSVLARLDRVARIALG